MARDLGKFGIRVVAIAPSLFETPMARAGPKELRDKVVKSFPMQRMGKPEEFAHLASKLVENTYVNGVVMRIWGASVNSHM